MATPSDPTDLFDEPRRDRGDRPAGGGRYRCTAVAEPRGGSALAGGLGARPAAVAAAMRPLSWTEGAIADLGPYPGATFLPSTMAAARRLADRIAAVAGLLESDDLPDGVQERSIVPPLPATVPDRHRWCDHPRRPAFQSRAHSLTGRTDAERSVAARDGRLMKTPIEYPRRRHRGLRSVCQRRLPRARDPATRLIVDPADIRVPGLHCSPCCWRPFAIPAPSLAQVGTVGTRIGTCIAAMRPAISARLLLTHPTGFDCTGDQSRFGSGDFDVVATALPPGLGRDNPVMLRTASVWQDRATLYARYRDGAIVRMEIGPTAATAHLQLGAVIQYRLPVREQADRRAALAGSRRRQHAGRRPGSERRQRGAKRGIEFDAGCDLCGIRGALSRAADLQSGAVASAAISISTRLLHHGRDSRGVRVVLIRRAGPGHIRASPTTTGYESIT